MCSCRNADRLAGRPVGLDPRVPRGERKRRERVNPSAVLEWDPVVLTFEVSRIYKGAVGNAKRSSFTGGDRGVRRHLPVLCSGDSGAVAPVRVSIVR
jgi:hypothetical protein